MRPGSIVTTSTLNTSGLASVIFSNKLTNRLRARKPQKVFKDIYVSTPSSTYTFEAPTAKITDAKPDIFTVEVLTVVPGRKYAVRISVNEYPEKSYAQAKLAITLAANNMVYEKKVYALFGKKNRKRKKK